MLTLYYRPTCAFCQSVLGEAKALGIKLDLKDISADPALAECLRTIGGKKQVPYLIDQERGEQMYEPSDIIAYLQAHYSQKREETFGGLRIHKTEEVCDTCQ